MEMDRAGEGVNFKFEIQETVFTPPVVDLIHRTLRTDKIRQTENGWTLQNTVINLPFEINLLNHGEGLSPQYSSGVIIRVYNDNQAMSMSAIANIETIEIVDPSHSVNFVQTGNEGSSLRIRSDGSTEAIIK